MHSNEAEMSMIGACILSEEAVQDAVAVLIPADFHVPAHRSMFAAIVDMHDMGEAVDLMTLSDELKRRGQYADCGGEDYLVAVAEYVVSPANSGHYAQRVKQYAAARNAVEYAKRVMRLAADGDPTAVICEAQKIVEAAEADLGADLTEWFEIDPTEAVTGTTTTYGDFDRILDGIGWIDGQTHFIGAKSGGGKTMFMSNAARRLADAGHSVVYAVFADLSPAQLRRRIAKQSCGVGSPSPNAERNERYSDEHHRQNREWLDLFRVFESKKHGRTVEEFAAKLKRAYRKKPFRVVFCDYAQRMTSRAVPMSEPVRMMEHVSKTLKVLAEDLNVAIVVGTQLTKRGDDLVTKYATAFFEDAGFVAYLDHEEGSGKVEFHVTKNRMSQGQNVKIDMLWNEDTGAIDTPAISYGVRN